MSKLLVVLGATGNQGGSVASTYLKNPAWRIRAVTRNPSKESAKKLRAQGVEVVAADLDDVDSLIAAFKDASMIFAVTDFWASFFDPAKPSTSTASKEIFQGKNIAAAAASAVHSLDLLVWSSLVDVSKESGGKYTWVYHFDGKAQIYNHIVATYPNLARKTSQVFMGSYMDNFKRSPLFGPQRQADGTFVLRWCSSPDTLEPFVDTPGDTGEFVQALEKARPGMKLFGVSDMRSGKDFMRVWSREVGVEGVYQQISREEFEKPLPDKDLARELGESMAFQAEFGWIGQEPAVLMPKDLGLKTTTIEEYVRREDWSSVLGIK